MLVLQVSQLELEVQALQERESAFKGAENEGVNEDTLNKYNDYSAALMKEYTSRKRMVRNEGVFPSLSSTNISNS